MYVFVILLYFEKYEHTFMLEYTDRFIREAVLS